MKLSTEQVRMLMDIVNHISTVTGEKPDLIVQEDEVYFTLNFREEDETE